jgi:hypothetical protein
MHINESTFTAKVREKLRFYVYIYIDPRNGQPFYIGKGRGNRVFSHLNDRRESKKARVIDALQKLGLSPHIEILKWGLTEEQALLVEQTAIDLLGVSSLTNLVRGHGSRTGSRATIEQVITQLDAKPVEIEVPAILIVINRAFRFGMSPQEIYDATRSAWKVGHKRERAKYAFAVYRGVVREVFVIEKWLPGGSTMRSTDYDGRHDRIDGRLEFVGQVAEPVVRDRYVGHSVVRYFKTGNRNPILYVNCDGRGSDDIANH